MTLHVATLGKVAIDSDPGVEYKAFTIPAVIFLVDGFKILENPALQLINLIETQFKHQGGRFFAANTTSAKHCHTWLGFEIELFIEPSGEFGK